MQDNSSRFRDERGQGEGVVTSAFIESEERQLIRRIAGGAGSKKAILQQAATRLASLGFGYHRLRHVWDGDAALRAKEMDRLRAAAKRERAIEDEARRELRELDRRLERIEALLREALEDTNGPRRD